MSSPINGIGSAAAPWLTPPGAAATGPGQGGSGFAKVAAAAGLSTQGSGSGGTPSAGTGGAGGTGGIGGAAQGAGSTTGGSPLGQSGATSGTGGTGSTAGATNSGTIADLSGTDTFLKLLVAQLKNQDPTSPMDDQAFVTELAQFNTVEQMLNLKTAMDTQTTTQQANEGIGMLGRAVTYVTPGVSGNNPVTSQGTVSGVSLGGGTVTLQIGAQQVPLSEVTAVGGAGMTALGGAGTTNAGGSGTTGTGGSGATGTGGSGT